MNAPVKLRDAEVPTRSLALSPNVVRAYDDLRLITIEEFADQAASLWRSVAEAAFRGDRLVLVTHCHQVAAVTRGTFKLVKRLGADTPDEA